MTTVSNSTSYEAPSRALVEFVGLIAAVALFSLGAALYHLSSPQGIQVVPAPAAATTPAGIAPAPERNRSVDPATLAVTNP